jgi:hypothetical protein
MSVFRASNSAADTDWSVPTPRGPYPVNPSQSDPDGPTQRLYHPADEPEPLAEPDEPYFDEPARRNRGVTLALVIAALALIASGGASAIAWHAMGLADEAGSMMDMHMPPAAPSVVPSAVPTVAASTAVPAASGYSLTYAQEPLQIRAACGAAALVDLDRPRVDAPEQQSDLRYDNRCGADGPLLSVGPGAQAGSHIADPDADAPGCAEAVRTSPLEAGESVPVQKGTVFCLLTTAAAGARPALALVEVTGVDAKGAASLRATAWTVPAGAPPDQATPPDAAAPSDRATPDGAVPADPDEDVPSEEATPGE